MRRMWTALLGLLLSVALAGCGDENLFSGMADDGGAETQLLDAQIALDEGNYAKALSLAGCVDSPVDSERRNICSLAYSGEAGFETLDLVAEIADAQDNNNSGSAVYDAVLGTMLDRDASGALIYNVAVINDKLKLLGASTESLAPSGTAANTDDQFKVGIVAAAQLALVSQAVIGDKDIFDINTTYNAVDRQNITNAYSTVAYTTTDAGGNSVDVTYGDIISDSLTLLNGSVDAIALLAPTGSDVQTDFETLIAEIDSDGVTPDVITADELANYLDTLN